MIHEEYYYIGLYCNEFFFYSQKKGGGGEIDAYNKKIIKKKVSCSYCKSGSSLTRGRGLYRQRWALTS